MKVKALFTFVLTGLVLMSTELRAMDSQGTLTFSERCREVIDLNSKTQIIAAGLPNERLCPEDKVLMIAAMERNKITLEKIRNLTEPTHESLELLSQAHLAAFLAKTDLESREKYNRAAKQAPAQRSNKCTIL